MIYNFDEIIERRNTNSVKWDKLNADNVLPMWIADMDFKVAKPILDAIQDKLNIGVLGYTMSSEMYYNAIIGWWKKRYDFEIVKDWIIFCTGVVPGLLYILKTFAEPGDKILIQSPVYNAFYRVINNYGCEVVSNDLVLKEGKYEIDFEDFEKKASDPKVKLMFLCNPHNPGGRVWNKEELTKLGEICLKHRVLVISDEIHCDLVYNDHKYIPFGSISEEFLMNSIACNSPSKTFNLAGLKTANMIIANKDLRSKVKRTLYNHEIGSHNVFGVEALIAAYDHGEEWLEQLLEYLNKNLQYLNDFFKKELPKLKLIIPEATYLVWVDCSELGIGSRELKDLLISNGKVWCAEGINYGKNGEGFIRINIACPREILVEGLNRIKKVIAAI